MRAQARIMPGSSCAGQIPCGRCRSASSSGLLSVSSFGQHRKRQRLCCPGPPTPSHGCLVRFDRHATQGHPALVPGRQIAVPDRHPNQRYRTFPHIPGRRRTPRQTSHTVRKSRPCVSTVLAIRHSANDEPQSGQAIVRYPLHFNHLQAGRDLPGRGLARATRTLFGGILEMALD